MGVKAPETQPLAVTAIGMMSPLGDDAVEACAAARAGISRIAELANLDFAGDVAFGAETMDGPPTINGSVVRGIGDTFVGVARALLLGGPAIDEILRRRALDPAERARTGLVVNLSDHFVLDAVARSQPGGALPSVAWRRATETLAARLAEPRQLAPVARQSIVCHGGNAGLAAAVNEAAKMLAAGWVDRCIVGAIDSRAEAGFLKAAARLRLLRTADNPVGLIPGEAAAFLLLERPADASRSGAPALASIASPSAGIDAVDLLAEDAAPSGERLAEVLRAALAASPGVAFSIGDLNGTVRRSVEWGNALVRLREESRLPDFPVWLPGIPFGDTGAAVGALGVCMAVRGFARRYAPGPAAAIWLSSESGAKAALVVRAPAA